ncbi:hypothetical protein KB559_10885 [Paenibacillus sp. Marseille-P2973]|uniref:hypothetical protein n=1 Tax=Paenibacillus sp. Marseille-P2973 TaxID=1871032 RepID=UPI001B397CE6|nr:hypothetical protein [Paenibacillus sp. Marseille-P2973]MBQ4899342.1 hypothetical protein [Paenibacillus sp. Marseille-P2973]
MKKLPYYGVYETFGNLFGYKLPQETLKLYIQKVPLGGVLNVLSQITALPLDNKKTKISFMKFLEDMFPGQYIKEPKIQSDVIYSKQGLLAVWKWLLAHGNLEHLEKEVIIENGINIVLFFNLIVSDYLNDSRINANNIKYELFANAVFNTEPELGSSLARSMLIFDEISKDPENFHSNDYIDIHTPFRQAYGYSIKEYLSVIFALFAGFSKRENDGVSQNWAKPSDYFQNSPLAAIAELIIDELSMNFEEAREWSLLTIDQPWNYTKFRQKPILKLANGIFFPIDLQFLQEKVFSELYFKIRSTFPANNTQVISFYGKCFEKYVEKLAEHSASESKLPYRFVPEFQYDSNSKRSPDALIRLNNSMLAIEAKVYRLKMDSLIGGIDSSDVIEEDIERMAIKPIKQLHDRVSELIDRNHDAFVGVEKLYFISVTFGEFPTLKPFELQIDEALQEVFQIPIAYHFHLDIEEFELLMELISRANAKPVFKILENKNTEELTKYMPFKNYLFRGSFRPKRSTFIQNQLNSILEEFSEIVSP